ncbi:type II toxin-antitoxin system RelE family toxin [Companilactobacillus versmoldensis]|uniref:Uncharacterized protein n=1 Tax=Companilactobacillus versmoldensis DSM 14857 = KCTC 3814 TaxID=1423815 RepID=A0A0R1SP52_9LACO|nr:type II toxin-antitoxin system RelE/ParE family toxin [Companilactobacillus versmoldensis]KRL66843.1 hypothetical protein FC27_GL000289 [Companilactobacillus versmoldensis DSM 14857 = KCTC 3814]
MNSGKYKLVFSEKAIKQLRKMDRHQAVLITRWLYLNIDGANDPRAHGKILKSNLAGFWRYRIGNYRIIVEIEDSQLVVLAINIGHRRTIYK